MILELPEVEGANDLSAAEIRMTLAVALYLQGRIGKIAASELAGVDYFSFQEELTRRGIGSATEQSLNQDLESLDSLFNR